MDFDNYWKDFCFRQIAYWEEVIEEFKKQGDYKQAEYTYNHRVKELKKYLYEKYLIEIDTEPKPRIIKGQVMMDFY